MSMAKLLLLVSLLTVIVEMNKAFAIPALQIYIEGAIYNPNDETWLITKPEFTLWVIGNVQQFGTIYDVKLAAAVKSNELGTITLTPTTTSLVPDPSLPPTPIYTENFPSPDGAIPIMHGGRPLPPHGIYGPGVKFYEWSLGNFTLTDSPIGDFIGHFPTEFPKWGQINAYIVTVSGFSWVHFDAYGYIVKRNPGNRPVFAPFSHDAEYTPEPSFLILVLAGGAILLQMRKRHFKA
ncbi:MAG: choice-of-anchor N protein [Armatimonadetes bacterium]|nr:choice-of-anchor N protein [Armatimonadota bacterium]MDW8027383.1 choice-of-anchor N protein [Armatimonadota bacterium]